MLECGLCGGTLTRRNWHSSSQYSKVIWQCVTATKKGKKFCKHSKGIPETAIEEAFVESYRLLCDDNKDVLEEFLQRMDDTLSSSVVSKQLAKAEKEIDTLEKKKSKRRPTITKIACLFKIIEAVIFFILRPNM